MICSYKIQAYFKDALFEELPIQDSLSSLVYQESIYGSASFVILSTGFNWSLWDEVARRSTSPIILRWGRITKEKEEWSVELRKCIKVLHKYSGCYQGNDKDPVSFLYIQSSLRILYEWLRDKMEKYKMFGAKEEAELL